MTKDDDKDQGDLNVREPSEKTRAMTWRRLLFDNGVSEETLDRLGKLTGDTREVYALVSVLDEARDGKVDLDSVMQTVVGLASQKQHLIRSANESAVGLSCGKVFSIRRDGS